MGAATFIEHKGTRVLLLDYSDANTDELCRRIEEAEEVVRAQPPQSVLILARMAGTEGTEKANRCLAEHVKGNRSFVLASAVVGMGRRASVVPITNRLTGRRVKAFEDESEALDWLVSRKAAPKHLPDELVRFVDHDGEKILLIDFRAASGVDLSKRIARAGETIRGQPEKSVLALTLMYGVTSSSETKALMKDYVRSNRAFIHAEAVVGLDLLQWIGLLPQRLAGRKVRAFDDAGDAMKWLVGER